MLFVQFIIEFDCRFFSLKVSFRGIALYSVANYFRYVI